MAKVKDMATHLIEIGGICYALRYRPCQLWPTREQSTHSHHHSHKTNHRRPLVLIRLVENKYDEILSKIKHILHRYLHRRKFTAPRMMFERDEEGL
jgi:hypothetical protein